MGFRVRLLTICEKLFGIRNLQRKFARRRRRRNYVHRPFSSRRRKRKTRRRWPGMSSGATGHPVSAADARDAYKNKPLPPLPTRSAWSTSKGTNLSGEMRAQDVRELSSLVHRAFDHLSYAISGVAAMVVHGCEERLPRLIDVVCSDESRAVFGNWALTKGFRGSGDGFFSVVLASGAEWFIRVGTVDDFHSLRRQLVRVTSENVTCVLSLPAIADVIAQGYTRALVRKQRQDAWAEDMRYVLRFIAANKTVTERLCPVTVPHITAGDFWLPFTLAYPDTTALFFDAGLRTDLLTAPYDMALDSHPSNKTTTSTPRNSFDLSIRAGSFSVPRRTDSKRSKRSELVIETDREPRLRHSLPRRQASGDYSPLRDEYEQDAGP